MDINHENPVSLNQDMGFFALSGGKFVKGRKPAIGIHPQDRVEHLSRQDPEHCRGGHYFKGEHRISLQSVS